MFARQFNTAPARGRRGLASLVCGIALLLVAAGPASAEGVGKPFHANVEYTFIDHNCGLTFSSHVILVFNEWETISSAGLPQFKGTQDGRVVFTNLLNGKSVSIHVVYAFQDVSVVASGKLLTVTTDSSGLVQVRASSGTVLMADVGRIVFVSVIDDNGTPLDTSDDTFVSGTIVFEGGAHPNDESGGTLFCAVVNSALT